MKCTLTQGCYNKQENRQYQKKVQSKWQKVKVRPQVQGIAMRQTTSPASDCLLLVLDVQRSATRSTMPMPPTSLAMASQREYGFEGRPAASQLYCLSLTQSGAQARAAQRRDWIPRLTHRPTLSPEFENRYKAVWVKQEVAPCSQAPTL